MAGAETVLVIGPDGRAAELVWPFSETDRQHAVAHAVDYDRPTMRRCGKGILGFYDPDGKARGKSANPFATTAFDDQAIALDLPIFGAVVFARNPSKGSVVKPLTAAQAANLLRVTDTHLI